MDRKAVAFARSWATRYVRMKHPHGLDVEDVENRILESLYKYGRGKMNGRDSARPSQDGRHRRHGDGGAERQPDHRLRLRRAARAGHVHARRRVPQRDARIAQARNGQGEEHRREGVG